MSQARRLVKLICSRERRTFVTAVPEGPQPTN
jgi:hypothetical protein